MFTDNHATILLDYTVKAMVVKFSNKKFNFILSCLENLREMKTLQMKRNEIDVFFYYSHAVHNNSAIARTLLPLFEHVEQCQKSRTVGRQKAVLRPS